MTAIAYKRKAGLTSCSKINRPATPVQSPSILVVSNIVVVVINIVLYLPALDCDEFGSPNGNVFSCGELHAVNCSAFLFLPQASVTAAYYTNAEFFDGHGSDTNAVRRRMHLE